MRTWSVILYVTLIIENIFRLSLSNAKSKASAHVLLGEARGKNLDMFLLRKGNFIMNNSDMVKPDEFGHLHLIYHFTVPLRPS